VRACVRRVAGAAACAYARKRGYRGGSAVDSSGDKVSCLMRVTGGAKRCAAACVKRERRNQHAMMAVPCHKGRAAQLEDEATLFYAAASGFARDASGALPRADVARCAQDAVTRKQRACTGTQRERRAGRCRAGAVPAKSGAWCSVAVCSARKMMARAPRDACAARGGVCAGNAENTMVSDRELTHN